MIFVLLQRYLNKTLKEKTVEVIEKFCCLKKGALFMWLFSLTLRENYIQTDHFPGKVIFIFPQHTFCCNPEITIMNPWPHLPVLAKIKHKSLIYSLFKKTNIIQYGIIYHQYREIIYNYSIIINIHYILLDN